MVGLSSQALNFNNLYHYYHPTKIIELVVMVVVTLIGGALVFYHHANTIDVSEQHAYVIVSFLFFCNIFQLLLFVVAVMVALMVIMMVPL